MAQVCARKIPRQERKQKSEGIFKPQHGFTTHEHQPVLHSQCANFLKCYIYFLFIRSSGRHHLGILPRDIFHMGFPVLPVTLLYNFHISLDPVFLEYHPFPSFFRPSTHFLLLQSYFDSHNLYNFSLKTWIHLANKLLLNSDYLLKAWVWFESWHQHFLILSSYLTYGSYSASILLIVFLLLIAESTHKIVVKITLNQQSEPWEKMSDIIFPKCGTCY